MIQPLVLNFFASVFALSRSLIKRSQVNPMKHLAFLFLCIFALLPLTSHAAPKPNVIFILSDDLGYGDLGCFGQKLIKTPNIDKLAAEGMRFTDAYAGNTVCAP